MWITEEQARDAADKLIEEAQSLEIPSWSSRELCLRQLATSTATELVTLGHFHPFVLVFSDRLHERLDAHSYRELWKAIVDAEKRHARSRQYPRHSDKTTE